MVGHGLRLADPGGGPGHSSDDKRTVGSGSRRVESNRSIRPTRTADLGGLADLVGNSSTTVAVGTGGLWRARGESRDGTVAVRLFATAGSGSGSAWCVGQAGGGGRPAGRAFRIARHVVGSGAGPGAHVVVRLARSGATAAVAAGWGDGCSHLRTTAAAGTRAGTGGTAEAIAVGGPYPTVFR